MQIFRKKTYTTNEGNDYFRPWHARQEAGELFYSKCHSLLRKDDKLLDIAYIDEEIISNKFEFEGSRLCHNCFNLEPEKVEEEQMEEKPLLNIILSDKTCYNDRPDNLTVELGYNDFKLLYLVNEMLTYNLTDSSHAEIEMKKSNNVFSDTVYEIDTLHFWSIAKNCNMYHWIGDIKLNPVPHNEFIEFDGDYIKIQEIFLESNLKFTPDYLPMKCKICSGIVSRTYECKQCGKQVCIDCSSEKISDEEYDNGKFQTICVGCKDKEDLKVKGLNSEPGLIPDFPKVMLTESLFRDISALIPRQFISISQGVNYGVETIYRKILRTVKKIYPIDCKTKKQWVLMTWIILYEFTINIYDGGTEYQKMVLQNLANRFKQAFQTLQGRESKEVVDDSIKSEVKYLTKNEIEEIIRCVVKEELQVLVDLWK